MIKLLLGDLRRRFYGILLFCLFNGVVEAAGVISLYPFLLLASTPSMVETTPVLQALYVGSGMTQPSHFVAVLGVLFVGLYVAMTLCHALGDWLRYDFSHRLARRLTLDLLGRYLRGTYAFLLGRNTGALLHQALSETSRTADLANATVELCIRLAVALAILAALLVVDPLMTLTTAAVLLVVYSLIYGYQTGRAGSLGQARNEASMEAAKSAALALQCLKEARMFPRRDAFFQAYARRVHDSYQLTMRLRRLSVMPRYATETLAIVSIVGVLIYLVLIGKGPLAVPSAGVFVMATWRLVPCLQDIYGNLLELRAGMPLLSKVAGELASSIPELPDGREGLLALRESVRLTDVRFAYPGGSRPAVDGVSLELRRHTSLALVGVTGAGKTTLADLIGGFLEPDSGRIEVDGEALRPETTLAWQRSLGYVPQTVALVDDTVWANVAVGVEPDRDAVREACRRARIADFIESELPDGYDTVLGERGVNLSGGQRQRIGIARALYHDPELLVLDEATSSLDNATEREVLESLGELARKKTLLVIAHRLTTVKQCDEICVLEAGRVVSRGRYEELLERCPVFQRLAGTELAEVYAF